MMKIVAAVTEQGRSTSLEKLDSTMCQVIPVISAEERAAAEVSVGSKIWPWFTVEDGRVQFEDASSRWFLGGRAVEGYECR
jgi:hypothetical protein